MLRMLHIRNAECEAGFNPKYIAENSFRGYIERDQLLARFKICSDCSNTIRPVEKKEEKPVKKVEKRKPRAAKKQVKKEIVE